MKIEFYKLQASGNDFILLDNSKGKFKASSAFYKKFAKKYCSRKLGIGADGVLVIQPSSKALFKMRIFNADGSEAEMCGNGARCVGLWASLAKKKENITFETKAGIIEARISGRSRRALVSPARDINDTICRSNISNGVKIKTSAPFGLKTDLQLKVSGRGMKVNFINTGVPHAVIFVQGLEKIDVDKIGREIRFHKQFKPAGANVNFVEIKDKNSLSVRTYERGVEAETLACGTGSVASAIISWFKLNPSIKQREAITLAVKTKSKDILKVTFSAKGGSASGGDNSKRIDSVWLEGEACLVYKGEIEEV